MHAGLDLANEQWGEGESGLRAARNGQALCERELGRERGECTVHTLTESGWTWLMRFVSALACLRSCGCATLK